MNSLDELITYHSTHPVSLSLRRVGDGLPGCQPRHGELLPERAGDLHAAASGVRSRHRRRIVLALNPSLGLSKEARDPAGIAKAALAATREPNSAGKRSLEPAAVETALDPEERDFWTHWAELLGLAELPTLYGRDRRHLSPASRAR